MRRTAVVRGRGGKKCLVMICEAGSELGKRCSWRSRTKTTAMINSRWLGARNCAPGRALRTSTAKPTACTAGCELVLHNGNFLGTTARDSWRTDTAVFLAQNGLAATALRCSPTEPTFGTTAITVCGGLGRSARARPRRGYIWCAFWTTRGRSSFVFVRRSTHLRQQQKQVHLASAFARGFPRYVDESRGAAVDS